jgi:hypothetical protein
MTTVRAPVRDAHRPTMNSAIARIAGSPGKWHIKCSPSSLRLSSCCLPGPRHHQICLYIAIDLYREEELAAAWAALAENLPAGEDLKSTCHLCCANLASHMRLGHDLHCFVTRQALHVQRCIEAHSRNQRCRGQRYYIFHCACVCMCVWASGGGHSCECARACVCVCGGGVRVHESGLVLVRL